MPTHEQVEKATAATEAAMPPQTLPLNIYEASGAVVVVAPCPAVTADDVTVQLDAGSLRLWARLRSAGPRNYLTHEWEYGGYERQIEVPDGFGADLEASLTNGQLVIRILKGPFIERITMHPTPLASKSQ